MAQSETGSEFERVVEIMHRLRAPGGCPWDREQTFDTIRPYTIEETYEVLEAIGNRDWPAVREELGDLLLQVLFYSELATEAGTFTITEVLQTLGDKLIRRHPHVFADESGKLMNAEQALGRWEEMKAKEKAGAADKPVVAGSLMDGVPRDLPALSAASKIGKRAAQASFDWPTVNGVMIKLEEEIDELRREMKAAQPQAAHIEDELGDILFTVANLARKLHLDPESALVRANRKFRRRFQAMEAGAAAEGLELAKLTPEELDRRWVEAKQRVKQEAGQ